MKETFQVPTPRDIETLIGTELYNVWNRLCQLIEQSYEMEQLWNRGGKAWTYEYKYRKGGKTLCALYAKERTLGFMVILGKDERAKFEMQRELFSNEVQMIYDEATTFHDGKWIMFELKNTELFNDMERLLLIKRNPNRKIKHIATLFTLCPQIYKWNVDLEDWEKVLRIGYQNITPTEISKALRAINIYAQELE